MEMIRCRVKRSYGWMIIGSLLMAGFFCFGPFQIAQEAPKSSPWPLFFIFGPAAAFFFLGAIYLAFSFMREEVIADETGLRWRSAFGPWKSARWEEISDFYLVGKQTRISQIQTSPAFTRPTVETPHGKLKLERAFARLDELLPVIAAHATYAPARGWEILELRASQNFSQRFSYWTKSQIWTAPIQSLGAIYVLGWLGWMVCFGEPSTTGRYQLSRPTDWLSFLMAVTTLAPIAGVFVVSIPVLWRDRNFAFQHRNEHLEVSPCGLAWQNAEKRIEASWDEVRAIQVVPGNGFKRDYRVETQNGDFTLWKSLESIELWLQLARQFAPQLAPEPFTDPDLGGEAATWSGGKIGVGARIFHFRTRTTRSVLWLVSALVLIVPLLPLLMHAMKTPDDDPAPLPWKFWATALIFAVLAVIYGWFCFRRAAIWANETGLEWRVPFLKTRRVNWSEIEGFGRDEWGFFIQTADKKRKLWQVSAPVRQNELLQLIAERATSATGKWDSI